MNDSEKTTGSLALKPKPRIITIPATGQDLTRPLRVAAYARVSSDSNDQLHSYAAQTAYFAKLINSNPNWMLFHWYFLWNIFLYLLFYQDSQIRLPDFLH